MKVAFHSNQLSERGTEVALYKYAKYNQEILNNESVIISSKRKDNKGLSKFSNFNLFLYDDECSDHTNNRRLVLNLEKFCEKENISTLYTIKAGHNDNLVLPNIKTVVHCVFRMDQPHGQVYAGVSEYIAKKYNSNLFVDHIVEKECHEVEENLRKILNIPEEAIVLGRHGGYDTFSLNVYDTLLKALENRNDLYFIFLNTKQFIDHPRVIFLPLTLEEEYKAKFVNTCDAMIHARADGETFGLAIAEFSVRNKPIITWSPSSFVPGYDTAHLDLLENNAIYYSTSNDLYSILTGISKEFINHNTWGEYTKKFSPEIVMQKFKDVFLL